MAITSIGYEPCSRELEIEFRQAGAIYRYFEVPIEEYRSFMAADSKGKYLDQVFKPRAYRYSVVKRPAL
jgi:hypothetical protein